MHRVASHLLGILAIVACGLSAHADSEQKTKTIKFNQFFRVGSYAVVHLDDVPEGEDALIHEVQVRWRDRDEKTEGQLYIDDFLYLWPEKVVPELGTTSWPMIDWPGHFVQIQILDRSEDQSGFGAYIEFITVTYSYPIPPEDDSDNDTQGDPELE